MNDYYEVWFTKRYLSVHLVHVIYWCNLEAKLLGKEPVMSQEQVTEFEKQAERN